MMKYIKKFNEAVEVSNQDIWNDYKSEGSSDHEVAEKLLDILTNGTWAGWDEEKIESTIQQLIDKYA